MGTRSTISIIKEDGSVLTSYCHWDGYPSNNGAILLIHYDDPIKVNQLISLGHISSLRKNIFPVGKHTYDNPEEGVTVFYGRDRKEKNVSAQKHKTLEDFASNGDFQEYDYVYDEKKAKWYLYNPDKYKLQPLYGIVSKIRKDLNPDLARDFEFYLKAREVKKNYKKMAEELNNSSEQPKRKMKV